MSEKYQIDGPHGEVIGVHFQTITQKILMVGSKSRYLPFLQHILFDVMEFKETDIHKEESRQKHKYRYYFKIKEKEFRRKWYLVLYRYKTLKIDSIIKIS